MAVSPSDEQYIADHLVFWQHLSAQEKRMLVSGAAVVRYPARYTLRTGDRTCIGILLVRTGQLRVSLLSQEGRSVTLFRIQPGNVCVLSASCVLDAISFDVCIDTETDTEVIVIEPQIFRRLADSNIYVKEYGYETAAERFTEVMWTMQQILFMKFDRRLALYLCGCADRTGKNTINLTHEQIAADTGSAREVVSRMLNYFASEKAVTLSRGSIEITDIAKLRKIAG